MNIKTRNEILQKIGVCTHFWASHNPKVAAANVLLPATITFSAITAPLAVVSGSVYGIAKMVKED